MRPLFTSSGRYEAVAQEIARHLTEASLEGLQDAIAKAHGFESETDFFKNLVSAERAKKQRDGNRKPSKPLVPVERVGCYKDEQELVFRGSLEGHFNLFVPRGRGPDPRCQRLMDCPRDFDGRLPKDWASQVSHAWTRTTHCHTVSPTSFLRKDSAMARCNAWVLSRDEQRDMILEFFRNQPDLTWLEWFVSTVQYALLVNLASGLSDDLMQRLYAYDQGLCERGYEAKIRPPISEHDLRVASEDLGFDVSKKSFQQLCDGVLHAIGIGDLVRIRQVIEDNDLVSPEDSPRPYEFALAVALTTDRLIRMLMRKISAEYFDDASELEDRLMEILEDSRLTSQLLVEMVLGGAYKAQNNQPK